MTTNYLFFNSIIFQSKQRCNHGIANTTRQKNIVETKSQIRSFFFSKTIGVLYTTVTVSKTKQYSPYDRLKKTVNPFI